MSKRTEFLVHAAVWLVMLLMPLTFVSRMGSINVVLYLMSSVSTLLLMVVFYANYLWLTPCYFATDKRRYYWLFNIVGVVALGVLMHYWMSYTHSLYDHSPHHSYELSVTDMLVFILRDIFNLAIAAAVATAMRLAMRWQKAETARREAEAARAIAELSNLRAQINPHFLLNTLNNIYALTAFDPTRAQEAIQELSRLLRHVLYDNQQPTVPLSNEVDFLKDYIQLMRLRLPATVEVDCQFAIGNTQLTVAPMLFISLVENAFKHGISPTKPSFIHISIKADKQHITCDIKNSNHPKTASDHSGHGIGLQQVQHRLELAYPGRYTWHRGPSEDGSTYTSRIEISCKPSNNHQPT